MNLDNYKSFMTNKDSSRRFKNRYDEKNGFKEFKELYKDKVKEDGQSPTGRVYIGINKEPLQKNDTGFGYKGVLLQDDNRELIQCSGCGKWMQRITSAHTKSCIGGTVNDYKDMFGLNRTQSLISDAHALEKTRQMLRDLPDMKKYQFKRGESGNPGVEGKKLDRTTQQENEFATCEKQLGSRLMEFIRNNRELPHRHNRGSALCKVLKRRYGSMSEAFCHYELPSFECVGPKRIYKFEDGTYYTFNMRNFAEREALFNILVAKCDRLMKI